MATATIYATTNVGYILIGRDSWTSPNSLTDYPNNGGYTSFDIGSTNNGKGLVVVKQNFFSIDASSLTGNTVSSSEFRLTVGTGGVSSNISIYARKYAWSDGSSAIRLGNWRTPSQLNALTNYANTSITGGTTGTVAATGLSSLNSDLAGNVIKFILISGEDLVGTSYPNNPANFYLPSSGNTSSQYPRVFVTYSAAPSGPTYNLIVSPRLNYQQTILSSSPILYWRMNTISGTTVTDYSGSARNGTLVNSTLGVSGLVAGDSDTAIPFNGINQRASLTSASWMDVSNITLEAIIKPDNLSAIGSILDRDSSGAAPRIFQFRTTAAGKFEVIFWDTTGALWTTTGNTTLVVGNTYHLAATHDGSTTKLYVNGKLDQTQAHSGTMQVGTRNFGVGANAATYQFFYSTIDEVAWYGTALSADTIAEHASVAGLF
jgi:hypothetical protein